jgi:hypothetical protein
MTEQQDEVETRAHHNIYRAQTIILRKSVNYLSDAERLHQPQLMEQTPPRPETLVMDITESFQKYAATSDEMARLTSDRDTKAQWRDMASRYRLMDKSLSPVRRDFCRNVLRQ